MGVFRLLTFLEQERPSGYCYEVSIPALARQFTLETGRTPVIVVDGTNFLYQSAYPLDQHDWMMGGQLAVCRDNIDAFIRAFQEEGIELVFYFDGLTPAKKRKVWIERKKQKMLEIEKLFERVKGKTVVYSANYLGKKTQNKQLPPLVGAFGQFMLECAPGCRVKVAADADCDEEIADFARREGCFAILAVDTDFVILESAPHFFSSRHLDLASMTTLRYDGKELAAEFSLQFDQLPLLATLMGNDFLLSTEVASFHRRIASDPWNSRLLITNISNCIRTLPSGNELYALLPRIAKKLLGNESYAAAMKESLQFYTASVKSSPYIRKKPKNVEARSKHWNKILALAKNNHVKGLVPHSIASILLEGVFELSVSLEDKGSGSLPCAALTYRRLRHRIYSILLREDPSKHSVIEEWCVYPDRPIRKEEICVEYLSDGVEHPGLLALWGRETPGIRCTKWELFAQSVSPLLSPSVIHSLPEHHVVPVVVLFYLTQECNAPLKEWEVDAILSMVALHGTTPRPRPNPASAGSHPPARAIECSNLFARGISFIILLMAACGLPLAEAMPWHYFDGQLLLQKYLQAGSRSSHQTLCNGNNEALKAFEQMKGIIYA